MCVCVCMYNVYVYVFANIMLLWRRITIQKASVVEKVLDMRMIMCVCVCVCVSVVERVVNI
jgi:hypothetical protein